MLRFIQSLICCTILFSFVMSIAEARSTNSILDNNQELDSVEPEIDDVRNAYYDVPSDVVYPSIPMDRLQMLVAKYRPTAYLRSPTLNAVNGFYRLPEIKRQVRYRQCYFNPISCFKK